MFLITTKVNKGIIFLRLYGSLNRRTIKEFSDEINYLLYEQGTKRLVINFDEVNIANDAIFSTIGNKLIEIFLSCSLELATAEAKLVGCSNSILHCSFLKTKQDYFRFPHLK